MRPLRPLVLLALLLAAPLAPAMAPEPAAPALHPGLTLTDAVAQLRRSVDAGLLAPEDAAPAAALLATRWQAGLLGGDAPIEPLARAYATPSEAGLALAARLGAPVDDEQAASLRALDALPPAQADAIAGALEAFLAFTDATEAAFAGVPDEALAVLADPDADEQARLDALAGHRVDHVRILAARNALLLAALDVRDAFPEPQPTASALCAGTRIAPAFEIDTSGCGSTHSTKYAFTLDVGGNDRYNHANGGNAWQCVWTQQSGVVLNPRAAGALLDIGGDDVYTAAGCNHWGATTGGTNGGAMTGSGFLYDSAGNDQYLLATSGGNGGGTTGSGFLLDAGSGNDHYDGWGYGNNGGAYWVGTGLLVEGGGNDLYEGGADGGNGGATVGGVGTLLDLGGGDTYAMAGGSAVNGGGESFASAWGALNPLNSFGLLLDAAGSDTFTDPTFSCANWEHPSCTLVPKSSLGALIDVGPADGTVDDQVLSTADRSSASAVSIVGDFFYFPAAQAPSAAGAMMAARSAYIGTVVPLFQLARDHDGDGHTAFEEAAKNADPASSGSRPWTDDDGDGIANQDEQSRLHAAGTLATPRVRATSSDHLWVHLGAPGATASVTSPTGATLRVTYNPGSQQGCRPGSTDVEDCIVPVVVKVGFAGQVLAARAVGASTYVPFSSFQVSCAPAPAAPLAGPCLVGTAVDATWTLKTGQSRLGTPSGMQVSVQGKTYVDVADGQGPIDGAGRATDSRSAAMPVRLWNWNYQPGATSYACSAPTPQVCLTGAQEESVMYATVFTAA